jgi:hypothetical protein
MFRIGRDMQYSSTHPLYRATLDVRAFPSLSRSQAGIFGGKGVEPWMVKQSKDQGRRGEQLIDALYSNFYVINSPKARRWEVDRWDLWRITWKLTSISPSMLICWGGVRAVISDPWLQCQFHCGWELKVWTCPRCNAGWGTCTQTGPSPGTEYGLKSNYNLYRIVWM